MRASMRYTWIVFSVLLGAACSFTVPVDDLHGGSKDGSDPPNHGGPDSTSPEDGSLDAPAAANDVTVDGKLYGAGDAAPDVAADAGAIDAGHDASPPTDAGTLRCNIGGHCKNATQACCLESNGFYCSELDGGNCPYPATCTGTSSCAAAGYPGTVCCGELSSSGVLTSSYCLNTLECVGADRILLCDVLDSPACPADAGACQPYAFNPVDIRVCE